MLTVARADESATAGQAWMLNALRLRGELTDGDGVDGTIVRTVLEEVVGLAAAKSIEELSQDAREHSGGAAHVAPCTADGLRQNLRRIAERFPVGRLAA